MSFWLLYTIISGSIYFLVFIFLRTKWIHYTGDQKSNPSGNLFISVIIPCYNDFLSLKSNIPDLLNQDYPGDLYEIIIVNDYSTNSFHDSEVLINKQLIIVNNKYKKGKKFALKTGVEAARGKVILTTDADCKPSKSWLSSVAGLIPENKMFLLSLPVLMTRRKGFFKHFQALEFGSLVYTGAASFTANHPIMCNGANLAFSKELFLIAFEKIYPDFPSGDDIFLMIFAKSQENVEIMVSKNPATIVYTPPAKDFASFFRQRFRWASKSLFYRDFDILFMSFLILVLNISLIVTFLQALFITELLPGFIILFGSKLITDLIFLSPFLKFFNQKYLRKFFLPSQLVYPWYISISALFGFMTFFTFRKNENY